MIQHRAYAPQPRQTTVNIRVTPKEKEALKTAAAAVGLSVAGYLLGLAAGEALGTALLDSTSRPKRNPAQLTLDDIAK